MPALSKDKKTQIAQLEALIAQHPENKNPYYYLGRLYEFQGEDKKAKQNYLAYLVRDIGFKDTASALDNLEKLDVNKPENAIHLVNLGQIYCYLNRFDEAEEMLQKGTIWETFQLQHYNFFMIKDSYAFKNIRAIRSKWQENYHRITSLIPERSQIKINYFLYESPVHKGMLTGDQEPGHCFPKRREVHMVYHEKYQVSSLHEDCHVLLHHIGQPLKLIDEGAALYVEHGETIHSTFKQRVKAPYPIAGLLDDESFGQKDLFTVYPQAGSFTGYLWQTYGFDRIKQTCQTSQDTSRNNPAAMIQKTYKKPVNLLEKEWLDFIANEKK